MRQGGDEGKWRWREVTMKGSADDGKWWWREVATEGSGDEGEWFLDRPGDLDDL